MTNYENTIIYRITLEDVQNVADQLLERELSDQEIELIRDRIAERIPWFDAIAQSINEFIPTDSNNDSSTSVR